MGQEMNLWFNEIHEDICSQGFKVRKTLYSQKSDFQQVEIFESTGHGKILVIDGFVMLTERDEFVYHEMIAHVPLFIHPNAQKVLVIGGGDGGSVREVLRHHQVESCTMIEIDRLVCESCEEHIPQTACELKNPKLNLMFIDGVKFVKESNEKFDLVIVDSTDPIGPATPLFGEEFYKNVSRILNDDGIVIAQGESPFYEVEIQKSMLTNLKKSFPVTHLYNFANLSYPGGFWSFTYASKGLCPRKDFDGERLAKSPLKFKYYNEGIHHAAFAQPQFVLDTYKGLLTPFK